MTLYDIVRHSVTNDAFCDNYQCDGSLWQIHTISFCGAIIDCSAGDGGTGLQNIMSAVLRSSTRYCPCLASCLHWCLLNWIGCMLHRQRVGPIVTAEVFLAILAYNDRIIPHLKPTTRKKLLCRLFSKLFNPCTRPWSGVGRESCVVVILQGVMRRRGDVMAMCCPMTCDPGTDHWSPWAHWHVVTAQSPV